MSEIKFERSTSGLRDALFSEMEDLKAGVSTAADAYAFATLAGKVIDSLYADMRQQRIEENRQRRDALLLAAPVAEEVENAVVSAGC